MNANRDVEGASQMTENRNTFKYPNTNANKVNNLNGISLNATISNAKSRNDENNNSQYCVDSGSHYHSHINNKTNNSLCLDSQYSNYRSGSQQFKQSQ